ncbi:hypothetical protein GIB67_008620 [Kingdonia uniflora]|uniref:Uncharacterized protein n=1 Tax=Kingdonia uniflora TaxID=39325 RepID=A0A7J7M4T3_9MAGN|nr:hypothetical protein GIB67_008620 [Kingdonia uniflora]
MKNDQIIRYFKCSSLWSGLKKAMLFVNSNSWWIIGNGEKIDFWRDCWGLMFLLLILLRSLRHLE